MTITTSRFFTIENAEGKRVAFLNLSEIALVQSLGEDEITIWLKSGVVARIEVTLEEFLASVTEPDEDDA